MASPSVAALLLGVLVIGVLSLAVAWTLFKGWRLRTDIYRYDVSRDQRFDFSPSMALKAAGSIKDGALELTVPMKDGEVTLLELRIESTLLGRWFEPYIELERDGRHHRQAFERGGSGLRYIELSALGPGGEGSVRLTGHGLEIRDQTVSVYHVPRAATLDDRRILVLGTHPDDAEIAAFGVYADRDAYVVTLTAGEAGDPGAFDRFGDDAHQEKGRNRAWNSVAVPMLGGLSIERTANLGYFDGTLPTMREQPSTAVKSLNSPAEFLDAFGRAQNPGLMASRESRTATWAHLVADLEHLVLTLQPDILMTPYPRLDAHPDHKMTTLALIEALKNLDWRRGSLLLYVNHLCSSDRYPFGNAGDLVSLPPGVDDIYFDGIVSHPLDARLQARKHMALDAMIDLRPVIQIDSLRSVATAFKRVLKSTVTDGQTSYFRQAVRANELFFEVRVASLYEPGVTEKLLA